MLILPHLGIGVSDPFIHSVPCVVVISMDS